MTPSKALFYFCIAFVVGIFLEYLLNIPRNFLWAFLFVAILIVFASLFLNKNIFIAAGFCLAFLVLGFFRMQIAEFNVQNDPLRGEASKLSQFNGAKEIVSLTGLILADPDMREKSQKLKIKIDNFASTILATTSRYPEYKYLDRVKLTGKLETPFETEDFSYKNYLMKDGIYSVMNFPKIAVLKEKEKYTVFSFIYEKILFFKKKLGESIKSNFSPPHSSILEGTVLGNNGAMSGDLKNKLNATGLRHIIAVSGTHVVILSSIIMSLLLFFGLRRGQAFYMAIVFISLYILLTGLPSSGIRAGIMGGLYLLAQKLGRQSMGSRVIAIASAVMLFINPLLLFYDVGFQLSFLAVMGLIYLEPFIRGFFKFLIKRFFGKEVKEKPESILQMVSTTFAAQIFTLPIMLYNFGNISFVAPITNILVLPIVSLLMIFGFLASIAGIFSGILGQILSVPCYFLLSYFAWVIDFFSKPWAMGFVKNISWIWLLASYLAIGILTRFLNIKYRKTVF